MILVNLKAFLVQKLLYYQTTATLLRNSTALNYLGASDKAIKLSFSPILMRAFRNWANEFHSIASPSFHAVSFISNFIGNFAVHLNNLYCSIYCSYTLHILFHSEIKITLFYLLLFAFIRFNLLNHWLSFVVIRYHSLYHSLSLVISLVVTRSHSLSLVVIRCHLLYH